jgi:hypothetical protein
VDTSSENEKRYAENFLDGILRKLNHFEWLFIDVLSGSETRNEYANVPSRSAIRSLLEGQKRLQIQPVSDEALVAAVNRVLYLAEALPAGKKLIAVILTQGTSDEQTIRKLTALSEELARSKADVTLYFAGVSELYRLPLSRAFFPVRERVQFFGERDSELSELLKNL